MSDAYIIPALLGFFLFISICESSKLRKELERYRIQEEIAEEAKRFALYKVWKVWGKEGLAKVKEDNAWNEFHADEFEGKDLDEIVLAKRQDRAKRLRGQIKPVSTKEYLESLRKHPYYIAYTKELEKAEETYNRIKELCSFDSIDEDERKELEYYLVFINFYLEHYNYLAQKEVLSTQLHVEVERLQNLQLDIEAKLKKQ